MTKPKSPAAQRFLAHLRRARELHSEVITDSGLGPQHEVLSRWQSQRLTSTYADLASQRRYRLAIDFFLTDLYGTEDFTRRDADLERIYPIIVRALSENALESLALAVELHALTRELDSEFIQTLQRQNIDIARHPDALDQALYAQVYRDCDNRELRLRQIELIQETGEMLDEVVGHPLIFFTVRLVRAPAYAAGLGDLQKFIERGLRAFKKMNGATHFLQTIRNREMFILQEILSGGPLSDWSAGAFND